MQSVILRNITLCTAEQIEQLRNVRNQDGIRQAMYTEHIITPDEHSKWISDLRNDPNRIVLAVLIDDTVSGAIAINSLDLLHKKTNWAFYLDSKCRGGLGSCLEFNMAKYAFEKLGLEKLNCEVIETNTMVVEMHQKFGFVIEGFRRANIIKNSKRIGVHFLGLTKDDWLAKREAIYQANRAKLERFSIVIDDGNATQQ